MITEVLVMRKIILAFDRELVIAERNRAGWNVSSRFKGANPITLTCDPNNEKEFTAALLIEDCGEV